jgi:hypothetical protein
MIINKEISTFKSINDALIKKIKPKDYPNVFEHFSTDYQKDNFYSFLEKGLADLGLGINVLAVSYDDYKVLGHKSYLRIYPGSITKMEQEDIQIIEDYKKFKNRESAYVHSYIYVLNKVEHYYHTSIFV